GGDGDGAGRGRPTTAAAGPSAEAASRGGGGAQRHAGAEDESARAGGAAVDPRGTRGDSAGARAVLDDRDLRPADSQRDGEKGIDAVGTDYEKVDISATRQGVLGDDDGDGARQRAAGQRGWIERGGDAARKTGERRVDRQRGAIAAARDSDVARRRAADEGD